MFGWWENKFEAVLLMIIFSPWEASVSNRDTNRVPELLLCGLQVIDTAALTTDVLSPMPHVLAWGVSRRPENFAHFWTPVSTSSFGVARGE